MSQSLEGSGEEKTCRAECGTLDLGPEIQQMAELSVPQRAPSVPGTLVSVCVRPYVSRALHADDHTDTGSVVRARWRAFRIRPSAARVTHPHPSHGWSRGDDLRS